MELPKLVRMKNSEKNEETEETESAWQHGETKTLESIIEDDGMGKVQSSTTPACAKSQRLLSEGPTLGFSWAGVLGGAFLRGRRFLEI